MNSIGDWIILKDFLLGFVIGFFLSIPIGPINLTVIHEAFRKGFTRSALIGLGGVLADTFYCAVAFFGFSHALDRIEFLWPWLQFFGGLIIFLLGVRYSFFTSVDFAPIEAKAESNVSHFHKAFPLGFFMGISNVSLFILWGGVNTLLISNGWLEPDFLAVSVCICGIATGSSCWFISIALFISRMHREFFANSMALITRICGFLLLGFGAILVGRLFLLKQPFFL